MCYSPSNRETIIGNVRTIQWAYFVLENIILGQVM